MLFAVCWMLFALLLFVWLNVNCCDEYDLEYILPYYNGLLKPYTQTCCS